MNKRKKTNLYKLTPEADKMLIQLSKELGQFQRKDKHGNLMFRKVTEFVGTKNVLLGSRNKLDSYTKEYKEIKQPILVNHLVELREIYQKDGQVGVDIYAKFFKDILEAEAQEQQKVSDEEYLKKKAELKEQVKGIIADNQIV